MSSLTDVNFSNSLPQLASFVTETLGEVALDKGIFVRDGFGRLSFYSSSKETAAKKRAFDKECRRALGLHVSPIAVLHDNQSPSYNAICDARHFTIKVNDGSRDREIRIVDRRFFGQDWLETPATPQKGSVPTLVFNSIKGGVGRSTALFVLSIALSRAGKNVLLIDLDLEAPGLGALIFSEATPRFGVVDYLVETALGGVREEDLPLFIGSSTLTDKDIGQGRVDLMPATGSQTTEHPRSMMAKLSRALIDAPGEAGKPEPLIQRVASMISRMVATNHYDAVLVDARAGLSEITASPILGLGATNLFFATNHPHTFEGYRYLLSHLSMLTVTDINDDWRRRIHFVHAKAKASLEARESFNDKLYDILAETFYEVDEGDEVFNFSYDDSLAPHSALRIFFSSEFIDADPIENPSLLESDVFNASFGSFIGEAFQLLGFESEQIDEPAAF